MNWIDAHSHIWTPDTASYPLAAGFRRSDMAPPSFTVEELQANMKTAATKRTAAGAKKHRSRITRYPLEIDLFFETDKQDATISTSEIVAACW